MRDVSRGARAIIGWREWVRLADWGIPSIKVKVDTGARTSSLHAADIEEIKGPRPRVRFKIWPEQRSRAHAVTVVAPLSDKRSVRPSTGKPQHRYVVLTQIEILGQRFETEVTLAERDQMGFRMLLGRQALRGRFVVDPGRSFLNGRRIKGSRRLKKFRAKP